MLVVDAANAVGARPDGWWWDRVGAARRLHGELLDAVTAGRLDVPLVLVLEGQARAAIATGATGIIARSVGVHDLDAAGAARPQHVLNSRLQIFSMPAKICSRDSGPTEAARYREHVTAARRPTRV